MTTPKTKKPVIPEAKYKFVDGAIIETKTSKSVHGLMKTLKGKFFPDYDVKKAKYKPKGSYTKEAKANKSKFKCKVKPRFGNYLKYAKNKGIATDNLITDAVKLMIENGISITALLQSPHGKRDGVGPMRKRLTRNKLAAGILRTFQKLKLRPVETQFGVGRDRCGTLIDVICENESKPTELVAIECKTGNSSGDAMHTGHKLPSPLSKYTDCKASQNQLQLAAGIGLFNSCHSPDYRINKGYVIKATEGADGKVLTVTRELNTDFKGAIPSILAAVC